MIIVGNQVEAAIYTTKIILLKFFNLFDLSVNRSNSMKEIPWIPSTVSSYSNPAIVEIPATQPSASGMQIDTPALDLYQNILAFPSICFTFTQVFDYASSLLDNDQKIYFYIVFFLL